MQYTLKAYAPEAPEPVLQTVALAHHAEALDLGRGLLRDTRAGAQVEVWLDERRIATVVRVV